jgi:hypothetical protein
MRSVSRRPSETRLCAAYLWGRETASQAASRREVQIHFFSMQRHTGTVVGITLEATLSKSEASTASLMLLSLRQRISKYHL